MSQHALVRDQLAPGEQRLILDPVGPDAALRDAIADATDGRWRAMSALLTASSGEWSLRTNRIRAIAAEVRTTAVVESWLATEPRNPDARIMEAAVAVERAILSHRTRNVEASKRLAEATLATAGLLADVRADPAPQVLALTLAQLAPARSQHNQRGPRALTADGPWTLLYEAHDRDPFNREAFHAMFKFWAARGLAESAYRFGLWAASEAPKGAAPLLLPLYGHIAVERGGTDPGRESARAHWHSDRQVRSDTDGALNKWFPYARTRTVPELSHLAYGLVRADRLAEASTVFDAMGPYGHTEPWSQLALEPEQVPEVIVSARDRARLMRRSPSGQDASRRPARPGAAQ
ncbi:hypothetical protein BIV57_11230 [Mangrovactinospora gilvigrisea]|uniref:DUF4034 domain-containing protein n=1 Tax=Mangrovactinospora gilvigrisea TaxID=1428644 RepID=A0A1J7BFG3_9ACTN|nr:hypothetical protein [Mangrovactinospora gilvigrisea]OIV37382.1 hypothetical protein BIV57_11230 [Mangrovactinospora gilvigrisea]